jgi:hypothetical protein
LYDVWGEILRIPDVLMDAAIMVDMGAIMEKCSHCGECRNMLE